MTPFWGSNWWWDWSDPQDHYQFKSGEGNKHFLCFGASPQKNTTKEHLIFDWPDYHGTGSGRHYVFGGYTADAQQSIKPI